MLPDRVSNPGPLTYESGDLPIALRGPAPLIYKILILRTAIDLHVATYEFYFIIIIVYDL